MSWDDGLVGAARSIAETDDSPLRVMSGPGTGKSFVMKRRIARLLGAGQDPRRILAVTFTRNAADNLIRDLHDIGVQDCEKVWVGTIHSFCFWLLERQEVFDYLQRVPRTVISFNKAGSMQFEGGTILNDLTSDTFGGKRECTKRVRAFEAAWARLQTERPGSPRDPIDQQFQDALIGWLRFHNAILIGELVPEAYRYIRNNPASTVRTLFDYVVVDEYQDLNKVEQELIDLLANQGSLAIVGDVDQSIYRFRYANPEGIDTFNISHVPTHDETLDECRRCPTRVVAMADHLICHNHLPAAVCRLRPKPDNPLGDVHIVQWMNVNEEAQGIAEYVQALIHARGYLPGDILILSPRRLLGYGIRDRISSIGIPVHSFFHEKILENEAAQRGLTILTLIGNPDDRVALRWWLGDGSPSALRNSYTHLRQHCERTGDSPRTALEALVQGSLILSGTAPMIGKYKELQTIISNLAGKGLNEIVDILLPSGNAGCAEMREVALLAITDCIDAGDLYDHIKAYVTQPEIPEKSDFIRVMSLHKSKGLTSKVTIIADCVQGLIPFIDDDEPLVEQDASLKEQRRLFYVAITRCTEVLVISSIAKMGKQLAYSIGARLRHVRAGIGDTITSTFIGELGPNAPTPRSGADWVLAGYTA